MFEYSTPLVFAQACQDKANIKAFHSGTKGQKGLVGQILDCSPNSSIVSTNLYGVLKPTIHFRHLYTSFQRLLLLSIPKSLRSAYLVSRALLPYRHYSKPFLDSLRKAPKWAAIVYKTTLLSYSRRLLRLHLYQSRRSIILLSYSLRHLSRLTIRSRSTTVLLDIDYVFLAPLQYQQNFV